MDLYKTCSSQTIARTMLEGPNSKMTPTVSCTCDMLRLLLLCCFSSHGHTISSETRDFWEFKPVRKICEENTLVFSQFLLQLKPLPQLLFHHNWRCHMPCWWWRVHEHLSKAQSCQNKIGGQLGYLISNNNNNTWDIYLSYELGY